MKPEEIKVGSTYCNKGAGRTTRTVLKIERGLDCDWYGMTMPPDENVVEFVQKGRGARRLYLSSFAAWAGKEVA